MLKVGLTGGIGAGKSTVAQRLVSLGAVLIDADRVAREVVGPGTEGLAQVVAAFGAGVLTADGALDRAALAGTVFTDDEHRARLNAIVHPLVDRRTAELVSAAPPDAVVVNDVPLLIEADMGARYHLVAVVGAPAHVRVRRLVEQRGMTEGDAHRRVAAQADDRARRAAADVWVDNAGKVEATLADVDRLWRTRLVPFEAHVRAHRQAPRPGRVEVVAPDPGWAAAGRRLVARVRAAAGDRAVRVDHVGSTAVPGLAGKDVVDLQLVVADLETADALRLPLEDAGFARLDGRWWDEPADGSRPEKRVHGACDPGRPVNLHVRDVANPMVDEQVLLRDWLRSDPAEREAYARVKRGAGGTGIQEYLGRKGPWIAGAVARARAWADATGWRPA
jgi:dephospho-CoA kinase